MYIEFTSHSTEKVGITMIEFLNCLLEFTSEAKLSEVS